jgi:hypothetical protein
VLCAATYYGAEVECREAENQCDVAETCSGYSSDCPEDATLEGEDCTETDYTDALCTSGKECLGEYTGVCSDDADCNNGKNCSSYVCTDSSCVYTALDEGVLSSCSSCSSSSSSLS